MNNSMKLFAPHLTMFGVEDKFNTRINANYIAQYWATNAKQHKQKSVGTGYKRTLAKFGNTKATSTKIGGDLPSVPLHPIQNLVNSQLRGGEYQLQLPTMNRRDKRSMFLYNQHLQGGDYYQQPTQWNDKGFNVHQPTGNPYTSWQKRNSGDAANKGSQSHLKLTGQTPQALVGHETDHRFSYGTGSFPTIKSGFQTNHRLQNTLNNNRNRFFQQPWDDHLPGNQSDRSLNTVKGHFNRTSQQESQQFDPTRFFMVGNRKVPPSYRRQSYGSGKLPSEGMLPSISQEEEEDELEEGYRYKYSGKDSGGDQNNSELMGRYAKYYRTQDTKGKKSSNGLRSVPSPANESNDKNNELLSRYLKHSAKKQVRSGSFHAPKYTGDYDPNVFSTGKVSSNEKVASVSYDTSKQSPQEEEEEKDSSFNKQEAAAEQKYRLEKATFPASLGNKKKDTESANPPEKGKYQLTYTKRKKMVIASTSDRENDPSMLVKGGDDVTTGTTDDNVQEVAERSTPEPIEIAISKSRSIPSAMAPAPKKPIKKAKKPANIPKLLPKIETTKEVEKKTNIVKNRRKSVKPVEVKRDSKKVEAQDAIPADVKTKAEQNHQDEETAGEEVQLQSLNEEEWLQLEDRNNDDENEGQKDATDDTKDDEGGKAEEAEDPLAALIPLRAKVPDYLKMSSMTGFLPITPVTFSWFPMSQQHREDFKRMSEQSKVPPSMRPFQNKNNK